MVSKLWRPDAGIFLTSTLKRPGYCFNFVYICSTTKDSRFFLVPVLIKSLKSAHYNQGTLSSEYLKINPYSQIMVIYKKG